MLLLRVITSFCVLLLSFASAQPELVNTRLRFHREKKQLLDGLTSVVGQVIGGGAAQAPATGDAVPTTGLVTAPAAAVTAPAAVTPTATLLSSTLTLSDPTTQLVGTDSDSIVTTGLLTAPGTSSSASSSGIVSRKASNSSLPTSSASSTSTSTSTALVTDSAPSTSTSIVVVTATYQADQTGSLQTVSGSAGKGVTLGSVWMALVVVGGAIVTLG